MPFGQSVYGHLRRMSHESREDSTRPQDPKRPVAVIAGAAAGVGRATARTFARRGYDVGLIARDLDGLETAAAEAALDGADVVVAPADVANADEVEEAAATIEERLGPIDVWVNNAMSAVFGRFLDVAADEFERVTQVTYLGQVNGTRAALRRMVPRDRGRVLQVGSALAFHGMPLQSAYCGAKHAIKGFTDSVRTELMHEGSKVTVGMVQLPVRSHVAEKTMSVSPVPAPEVAARGIVWMAEQPGRRELWVGGGTGAAILASRLAPGLMDRYLARTAVDSQLTGEPADASAEDNPYQPVPSDQGAHAEHGRRSRSRDR